MRKTEGRKKREREREIEIEIERERARKCILPEARDGGPQCPVVIYRGGMECGSGKEAELPVLGDTGSHCHTVTVGTTHAVVR